MKITIGDYLCRRLVEIGVGHVFGVPGDFNLQLLEQMHEAQGPEFIGTCNELNASYAADGYARVHGIGAMLTTYGVGDLSALCGLAGACAEHVPVVMISGTPPLHAMESRLRMHHSLAEGNFDNINICLRQFTCGYTKLKPVNAAGEIDRVLVSCWREKLPVFIQVPSSISYLEVGEPDSPLVPHLPESDTERLSSAVDRIVDLLAKAERPLLFIDTEVDRSDMTDNLHKIVRKLRIPYVSFRTGKALLPETDPLYLGMYNGGMSSDAVKRALAETDCLVATAPCFVEASPMVAPQTIPASAKIYIRGLDTTIEGCVYEGVSANHLAKRLRERLVPEGDVPEAPAAALPPAPPPETGMPLTQARLWKRVEGFLREGDLVCGENGTALVALMGLRFPKGASLVAQPIWGSIGYSLPALLGAMTAAPDRRALLFIGDGSLQMTVQELSTVLNRGLKPIIFVLNNRGYTIERYILGMDAAYNDISNWDYEKLPSVLAPEVDLFHAVVETEDGLERALGEAGTCGKPCLIELRLDRDDAPASMKSFGALTAELDYGPRGPQRR